MPRWITLRYIKPDLIDPAFDETRLYSFHALNRNQLAHPLTKKRVQARAFPFEGLVSVRLLLPICLDKPCQLRNSILNDLQYHGITNAVSATTTPARTNMEKTEY